MHGGTSLTEQDSLHVPYPEIGLRRPDRFHPDLITTDYTGDTARLLALGATKINEVESGAARWTTFTDVEGNEFDLIAG